MQRQLAVTQRRRPLIINFHITGIKFLIVDVRASSTVRWSGQQMGDRSQKSPEQYAADIESSRNGDKISAKPLQHRWKHEIQWLSNLSRQHEQNGLGLIDRAHWARLRHSMEGDDDGDADTGTDTATPDDDIEDISSLTSQQSTSLQLSNFWSCLFAPLLLLAL